MLVREFVAVLQALESARANDAPLGRAVNVLKRRVSGHEHMAIEDFLRLFERSSKRAKGGRASSSSAQAAPIVNSLRSVFSDDAAFEDALLGVANQRAATKAVLTEVFHKLFDRKSGVPKSATRAELLRLISDERHILVRNEKMGKMLGRKPVSAE